MLFSLSITVKAPGQKAWANFSKTSLFSSEIVATSSTLSTELKSAIRGEVKLLLFARYILLILCSLVTIEARP